MALGTPSANDGSLAVHGWINRIAVIALSILAYWASYRFARTSPGCAANPLPTLCLVASPSHNRPRLTRDTMNIMRLYIAQLASVAILAAQTPAPPAPATSAPATPLDPNRVVITIGDRHLTALEYEVLVKTLVPADQQASALGAGRRVFAQRLVAMFTLADEAVKQKLDQRPDVAVGLLFQRESFLETAMFKSSRFRPPPFPTPTSRLTTTLIRTISQQSPHATS